MRLRSLDTWSPNQDGELYGLIDSKWSDEESDALSSYLKLGSLLYCPMSRSPKCTMCDFTLDDLLIFTDGVYSWSQIMFHYVGAHKVRPPEPVVSEMLSRMDSLRRAEQSQGWWNDALREAKEQEHGVRLRSLDAYVLGATGELTDVADATESDNNQELADCLEFGTLLGFSDATLAVCTICDFAVEDALLLTDGVYVWSQILFHYVGVHNAKLPEPAGLDMLNRLHTLQNVTQDVNWWRDLIHGVV